MIPDSNDVLEPDEQRVSCMAQRLRKLLCKRRKTSRFEVALWCWLLLDVGAQLRCDRPLPSAVKHWRKVETRANLSALVKYVDEHIARTLAAGTAERAAHGVGDHRRRGTPLHEVIGIRDFAESARVALRWLCRGKRFAAEDLPGWASLSQQVERLDEQIAARAAVEPLRPSELWLVDLDDAANWLARLGVRPAVGPRRRAPRATSPAGAARSQGSVWPWSGGDEAPDWPTVHRFLVDGEHERLVLRHAEADPGFARTLEILIRFWGRRASRRAAEYASRRSIHGAGLPRQSRPEVRLLAAGRRAASALSPTGLAGFFRGESAEPVGASCICEVCGAWYVGTGAGDVHRLGSGAAGTWERRYTVRPKSGVAALCHLHLAAQRARPAPDAQVVLLAGADDGMLRCFAEVRGRLDLRFALHVAHAWAEAPSHGGGRRRLRFGDPWPRGTITGAGVTALAALPRLGGVRAQAREALVATRDGGLYVLGLHRGSITLRRIEASVSGSVHTIAPVADGLLCLSTAGELVNLSGGALRGTAEPEVLGRFESAAEHMVPLDDGFAPVLLLSGAQGAWIYDVARDRRVSLRTQADVVSQMTRIALADGPHVALGTAGGDIEIWSVDALLSWLRCPMSQPLGPGEPLLLRAPPTAAGAPPNSETGPVSGLRALPGDAAHGLAEEKARPQRDLG